MNPKYLVVFYTDGDLTRAQVCYFDAEEGAKALYDSLKESELIWRVSLSEVKAYDF